MSPPPTPSLPPTPPQSPWDFLTALRIKREADLKIMKINEPCSEDYQCGWNRGVADFQKNITSTITASEGRTGRAYAEFIEGYLASQSASITQGPEL